MKTKALAAALAMVAGVSAASTALARSNDWERISRRIIPKQLITETIVLGREVGRFSRLRIQSDRGNLVIRGIKVRFGNGRTRELLDERRVRLSAGEQRDFDLPGNRRFIDRIELSVRTRNNSRRNAILDLQGRSVGETRPGRFEVLETTEYNSARGVLDIPIGREEGRYTVIQLRPLDRNAFVESAEIVFGNGKNRRVRINQRLTQGNASGDIVIANRRGARAMRGIRLRMRETNRPRLARMQVLGRDGPYRDPDRDSADRLPGNGGGGRDFRQVGDRSADLRDDSISVPVRISDRGALRIRPVGANIELRRVTVEYRNGGRKVYRLGERVQNRTPSSRIRLGDGERRISRVLVYVAPRQRRGTYEVQVLQASSGPIRQPRPRPRPPARDPDIEVVEGGWMKLGAKRAQLITKDTDSISVGRRFGRIDRIRLTVRKNKVRLYGLTVTYANGETESLPFFGKVQRNVTTDPIDLKGKGRIIERVRLRYRSVFSLRGEGIVEIWGRRARGDRNRDPLKKLERTIRRGVRDLLRDN